VSIAQKTLPLIAALLVAPIATGSLLFIANTGNAKLMAASAAGLGFVVVAFISGNPRLLCLWGLMLTVPLDLSKRFGPTIAKMGGESSFRVEISDPFVLALLAFQLREILDGRRRSVRVPRVAYVWFAIMLLGMLAMATGPWRTTAAHEVVRMVKVFILFFAISNELSRPRRILQCAVGLMLSVTLQSLIAIYQYTTRSHLGLDMLGETGSGTIDQLMSDSVRSAASFRAGALLSHPNIFGIFLVMLLPLAVGLFLVRLSVAHRLLCLVTISLGMAALITTLSRSGWVSFAAAFFTLMGLLALHRNLRRRSLTMAMAASAALGIVVLVFAGPILERVFESKEGAMLSRYEYMETAARMIWERPALGWGMNSYVFVAPPFTRYGARDARARFEGTQKNPGNWLPPVHNIYLLWFAETGIVGLALHLWLLGLVIRTGIRNLKVRDEVLFVVNAACLAGFAALLVDGMFSFSLRINSILRVFWVLAGILACISYWRFKEGAEAPPEIRATSPVAPLGSAPVRS